MAKSGSFRPGKSGPSAPRVVQGRNGPNDKGGGTAHHPHPSTGTNRNGGVGGNANADSGFKPGH